ncbi:MAG TPA: cytochrome c oxidase subunit II [Polyangiaceae bacterium]|nr:cytochrome c oxidase subunit II [Polyangiaceae bacterium]
MPGRVLLQLVAGGSLVACGSLSAPEQSSALRPISAESRALFELGSLFFWTTLAVWVAVVFAALWGTYRGLKRANARPAIEPPPEETAQRNSKAIEASGQRAAEWAVAASTVVSICILFGLLIASIRTGRALAAQPDETALHIRITAHQWWWEINYSGGDLQQSFTTASELHLPAGRRVELELTSADVIHSFWVPNLHGKRDLIPSHITRLSFRPDQTGTFRGHCAEFCGLQHAHMDLPVVVETPTRFASWYEHERSNASVPHDPETQRGREIFMAGPCAFCHNVRGTDARGSVGPDLSHFGSRPELGAGAAKNTPESLKRWITQTQHLKPGTKMPATVLSQVELDALARYLQSLK